MAKKCVGLLLCAVLVAALCGALAGCDNSETKIVYLGDSIAEAVLGPSPLSERENYGYYALVGKRNGYTYINRSVSGHKTSNMLEFISREEDDGALMTRSHIMEADIIHVSILGNDMLQTDVGALLLEMVREDVGDTTGSPVREGILEGSRANFAAIVGKIKELNPDAVLMFQTVYNPIYPETTMINAATRESLTAMGYDESDYRGFGAELISKLNGVIFEYLEEHPDAFYVIDAFAEFARISDEEEARGRRLIYPDWVHPSNEGHAVMADLIQTKLEELGLADRKKAFASYQKFRKKQLARLYPDADYKKARKEINDAETCAGVTAAYFRATDGIIPVNY